MLFAVSLRSIQAVTIPQVPRAIHVDHAVNPTNPHLHHVPMQNAAERGLPALDRPDRRPSAGARVRYCVDVGAVAS